MPDRPLVKRRWTDSSLVIKPIFDGDRTGEQYSTSEHTYTLKALTSEEGFLDRKHVLIWKSTLIIGCCNVADMFLEVNFVVHQDIKISSFTTHW